MSEKLNEMLNRLNEEGEVSGVTRQKMDVQQQDWDKVPTEIKKVFKQYKMAGGECETIWDFMKDIAGFLDSKKFTGRHIAAWDKKEGPESEEVEE